MCHCFLEASSENQSHTGIPLSYRYIVKLFLNGTMFRYFFFLFIVSSSKTKTTPRISHISLEDSSGYLSWGKMIGKHKGQFSLSREIYQEFNISICYLLLWENLFFISHVHFFPWIHEGGLCNNSILISGTMGSVLPTCPWGGVLGTWSKTVTGADILPLKKNTLTKILPVWTCW